MQHDYMSSNYNPMTIKQDDYKNSFFFLTNCLSKCSMFPFVVFHHVRLISDLPHAIHTLSMDESTHNLQDCSLFLKAPPIVQQEFISSSPVEIYWLCKKVLTFRSCCSSLFDEH